MRVTSILTTKARGNRSYSSHWHICAKFTYRGLDTCYFYTWIKLKRCGSPIIFVQVLGVQIVNLRLWLAIYRAFQVSLAKREGKLQPIGQRGELKMQA